MVVTSRAPHLRVESARRFLCPPRTHASCPRPLFAPASRMRFSEVRSSARLLDGKLVQKSTNGATTDRIQTGKDWYERLLRASVFYVWVATVSASGRNSRGFAASTWRSSDGSEGAGARSSRVARVRSGGTS